MTDSGLIQPVVMCHVILFLLPVGQPYIFIEGVAGYREMMYRADRRRENGICSA